MVFLIVYIFFVFFFYIYLIIFVFIQLFQWLRFLLYRVGKSPRRIKRIPAPCLPSPPPYFSPERLVSRLYRRMDSRCPRRRSAFGWHSNSRVSDLSGAGVQQLIDPYLELEWGPGAATAAPGVGRAPRLRPRRD